MTVQPFVARQQAVERGQQVLVGPRPDLDDDEAGGRVRDEDRQQAVVAARRLRDEPGAPAGQVDEPAIAAGADRQLARVYGKMFRIASRKRPIPPPTGADS